MSDKAMPTWRTREGCAEADFDAIWLYERASEWTFEVKTEGLVICRYLASEPMPAKANTWEPAKGQAE